MTNLIALRTACLSRFHPNQDWFAEEPFAVTDHFWEPWNGKMKGVTEIGATPSGNVQLYPAVVVAAHLLEEWSAQIGHLYLWTSDLDHHGQRVYVGQNGKGIEIHRHIHISQRFASPVFG